MDWSKVKRDYIQSDISLRNLAKKHGIPYSKVAKEAARDKWSDKRNQNRIKTESKVLERISDSEANNVVLMADLWGKLAAITRQSLEEMVDVSPEGLSNYAKTLAQLQKGLGLKDKLDKEEQQVRIEKMRYELELAKEQKAQGVKDEVILGAAEEWAK